jgi:hypothetical protein
MRLSGGDHDCSLMLVRPNKRTRGWFFLGNHAGPSLRRATRQDRAANPGVGALPAGPPQPVRARRLSACLPQEPPGKISDAVTGNWL